MADLCRMCFGVNLVMIDCGWCYLVWFGLGILWLSSLFVSLCFAYLGLFYLWCFLLGVSYWIVVFLGLFGLILFVGITFWFKLCSLCFALVSWVLWVWAGFLLYVWCYVLNFGFALDGRYF